LKGRRWALALIVAAVGLAGCRHPEATAAAGRAVAPTFSVPDAALPDPFVVVAYGDTRFTNPAETQASSPAVRRALVARIASLHPAAIFLNGDLPWHGNGADYDVMRAETAPWRDAALRVYPALGNHEFSQCAEAQCLELWWNAFPELRGRRWYSVALGTRLLGVMLDSETPLDAGSEQRLWLEAQFGALDAQVRFVLIVLHHPPVADIQSNEHADHNPRPNERALADYLAALAPTLRARLLVSAGHIHNYERRQQDGVTYLVSGGGGAQPYEVERTPDDLYQGREFPNYHYVRIEVSRDHLAAEMVRLADPAAPEPGTWEVRDRFQLQPPGAPPGRPEAPSPPP
jgi:hypothetical protein